MKIFVSCFLLLALAHTALANPPSAPTDNQQRYTLSICTCFQNEARWLKEWIEFHKVVGVEHFYLFSNRSQDNYREVLRPYIDSGEVDLFDWDNVVGQCQAQVAAFNYCVNKFGRTSQWIAFIDLDEFLFPVYENDLKEVLKDYEQFGGLAVHWLYFGTSGIDRLDGGDLLIDRLTKCAPPSWYKHRCVKTICRTDAVKKVYIHYCDYRRGLLAVDSNEKPVRGWKIDYPLDQRPIDRIRINHYWVRTREWAYGEKLRRLSHFGKPAASEKEVESRRQELEAFDALCEAYGEDQAIQRFVPALKERLKGAEHSEQEPHATAQAA